MIIHYRLLLSHMWVFQSSPEVEKEKETLKERGKEVRELLKVVTVSSLCFCWHKKFTKQCMLRCTFNLLQPTRTCFKVTITARADIYTGSDCSKSRNISVIWHIHTYNRVHTCLGASVWMCKIKPACVTQLF